MRVHLLPKNHVAYDPEKVKTTPYPRRIRDYNLVKAFPGVWFKDIYLESPEDWQDEMLSIEGVSNTIQIEMMESENRTDRDETGAPKAQKPRGMLRQSLKAARQAGKSVSDVLRSRAALEPDWKPMPEGVGLSDVRKALRYPSQIPDAAIRELTGMRG